MLKVTITLSNDDAELLQKAADNMTAWNARRGRNTIWTIEDYLRIGALQQAREDLERHAADLTAE
ncbi:hypothetical protein [Sporomusa sphaeroides]|uniref:Uncharacterized protein n=1 Tax=Sporomusa sphaeroides DSM 2875 TaxID=1337886 RepID=A0ABM9VZZ7_9FIRM|nr:hypothetical protein [Sporomusa sphaeroides]OLS56348.1 hypothetical protein SPSPH_27410 [Sporomusa sphaeroides DSM 2875]CVK18443.1 hypothetical protein SSPH_01081 [Sporomusa sphaeroides DSM 2875]